MLENNHKSSLIPIVYLIDTITCDTSGTEKQLLETIKKIDKNKFEPYLVCLYDSVWMQENSLPCPCVILGYNGFLKININNVLSNLRQFLIKKKIKIIQTFFEDSIFIAWCATRFFQHDLLLLSSRRDIGLGKGNQPWYHSLFGVVLPFVNKTFDGIIANSQQVKKYVAKRERTPKEKIKVIYNGVGLIEQPGDMPDVFLKNDADVWIVIAASLSPVKRHDLLIKAIAKLHHKINEQKIRVLILGSGPERVILEKLIHQKEVDAIFHFEGAVLNVYDYLKYADIGVLCSDKEGFSNAILEYMINGLPVIATAVGGNIELVDEHNGICVPANDHKALAKALQNLILDRHQRQQMGIVSKKRVKDKLSWEKAIQRIEEYYQTMLSNKKYNNA